MKRRKFLITGSAALAAGTTNPSGIRELISPNSTDVSPEEMNKFLIDLDGAMNRIAHDPRGGRFVNQIHSLVRTEDDALLFRQGMRTLLLVGNFGDLSLSGQVHPGMQKRMRFSLPEMDAALLGVMDGLKALSPTARADVKLALRRDPELGDRVLEAIDREAGMMGVPARRRLQLRTMGKRLLSRMKHSSSMLIDEYVGKCEKIVAQDGSAAETQRELAARMGEATFKARQEEINRAVRRWQDMDLQDVPIGYQLLNGSVQDENADESLLKGPSKTFGIGLLVTATGWALIGLGNVTGATALMWPGVVMGVTVGPIMILVGLIVLLASAGAEATDDR